MCDDVRLCVTVCDRLQPCVSVELNSFPAKMVYVHRVVSFRSVYIYFFIEDASLRQAVIEFLKNIGESLLVNLII